MMPAAKPSVYLILGAARSGRRKVLADLLADGAGPGDRTVVMLSEDEAADPCDAQLGPNIRWRWTDGAIDAPPPGEAAQVFFVTDGRRNPVDQIEAFKVWIEAVGGELARVLCIVNCQWAEQHPELLTWYDACIHFADVVLLNKREGVANKWISDFKARYTGQFYPCLFEMVKNGRVKNPVLLLETEARRLSHFFDEPDDLTGDFDSEDEDDDSEEDDAAAEPEVDPYLARRPNGRRALNDGLNSWPACSDWTCKSARIVEAP